MTKARFFRDRPDIEIPIRWFKVPPHGPKLPFPTSFMSQEWTSSTLSRINPNYQDEPWLQRPGEVFDEPRVYDPTPSPIGLGGSHVCGTEEDFLLGAVYDPTLDVKYDEQGLPLCCGAAVVMTFPLIVGFTGELEEGPEPGDTCETAEPIDADEWQFWEVPAGVSQYWHVPVTSGMPVCFHIDPGTPNDLNLVFRIWRGTSCPGALISQFSGNPGPEFTLLFSQINTNCWVQVRNDGASPIDYGFKVAVGAC